MFLFKSMSESSLKTIVCGDFNNTAYSWAYRKIKGDLNDTFLVAIRKWKQNSEHQIAQQRGKEKWYREFKIRICKVELDYFFER